MSFTTRCPACGTTFKIVPDQLKISDGWVRCGHCADVFDATLFLEGEAAPAVPVKPELAVAEEVNGAHGVPADVADPDGDANGDWLLRPATSTLPAWASVDPEPAPVPEPIVAADPVDDPFVDELRRFSQSSAAGPSEAPGGAAALSTHVEAVSVPPPPVAAEPVEEEGYVLPVSPEADTEVAVDEPLLPAEPSFVRQARRKAFWQSRGVRVALVAVSLLLGLGLLAQHAVHERDSLAARFPSAMPLLTALCVPAGCQIGPVRQIESVVIDSSNLVRRLGNFYSFDFVLKNSARMPVAVPALELSLTDTREAVIVRRVFLPDELPGAPQLLPAQGSLSLSLRLSIADQGVSSMSGYRALVFYP